MKERRESTQQGCNLTLSAVALLETSAQTLFNFVMAPTDASGFLTAAKECIHSASLPFVSGWREFRIGRGASQMFAKGFRDDMSRIRRIESIFLASGLTFLAVWGVARFHGAINSKTAIARFEAAGEASYVENDASSQNSVPSLPVDFSLWSPKRIAEYENSLAVKTDLPLAILRIPKIKLEAPVFNDTDDLTLNRGVGRILGTARIGESGNLGIAGHRDGFFRGLQSISLGDLLELLRPGHTDQYVVSEIRVVTPDDISVLHRTAVPTVTLVTCFPFYFVGHAPKRYIVTATASIDHSDLAADKDTIFMGKNTTNKENKK